MTDELTEHVESVMSDYAAEIITLQFISGQNAVHANEVLRELRKRAIKEAAKARSDLPEATSRPRRRLTFRPQHVPEDHRELARLLESNPLVDRGGDQYVPTRTRGVGSSAREPRDEGGQTHLRSR